LWLCVGVFVGVLFLAAPWVRFCSMCLLLSLNDTHKAEPFGRN